MLLADDAVDYHHCELVLVVLQVYHYYYCCNAP